MDTLHSLLKWIDHNRGLAIGIVLAVLVSIWLIGCTPKTTSILVPDKEVTATELEREIAQVESDFAAKTKAAELARGDIQRQYELRARIMEVAGGVAQLAVTGTVTPSAAAGSALQLLTLFGAAGLIYDNRRKDKVIETGKPTPPATA